MEITVAERLGGKQFGKSTEIYKFEKIKRAKEEARKKHPDIPIIDMGVGEPDQPADPGQDGLLLGVQSFPGYGSVRPGRVQGLLRPRAGT